MSQANMLSTTPYQSFGDRGVFPITVTATPATLGALMVAAGFTIPVITDSGPWAATIAVTPL